MYPKELLLSDNLRSAHSTSWQSIGEAGDFFTGAQRVDMVRSARAALSCALCQQRKKALSPNAVTGAHDDDSTLSADLVDLIHRVRTDPGRLTKAWFDQQISAQFDRCHYVEVISVVTTSVIIDTLHQAMGLPLAPLPKAQPGEPRGQYNADAVDMGAWVPIMQAPTDLASHGLPNVPNIVRSMGLVPSAVELFFTTFSPHYSLSNIKLSISQAQAEFVAARVSSINECFY